MAKVRSEINCDGCSEYFDGDLADLLSKADTHGLTDPVKIKELTYFWLCGECVGFYPNGAKDFFVTNYFEIEDPYCSDCEIEPVSEWGLTCGCE